MTSSFRWAASSLILQGLTATAVDSTIREGAANVSKPNLIWILTDDQDQMLGASFPLTTDATPMPKTKRLLQDGGAYGENWYIHSPICSPSRAELLTGRYYHNVKTTGDSVMHVDYQKVNANLFARYLKEEAGYTTGMFGKYMNSVPEKAPPGFDAWLANEGGNYVAPTFFAEGVDGIPDGVVHFTNHPANYTTSVVGNYSINWIKSVAHKGKPFFAYIAPKAAHEPFIPPEWYLNHWDPSWPEHEVRGENWNCSYESRKDHHGNIATNPMLTEQAATVITGVFKNRWRTLMAVDDLIGDVVQTIDDLGLTDSTYIFYSSDHGFNLGQFNMLMDKRQIYEWNIKIHLLARGPGIKPGSSFSAPGTQVDIAPTFLGFAGLPSPDSMDGRSIVPFLVDPKARLQESTRKHLLECGSHDDYAKGWRKEVYIEYYFDGHNTKCAFANGSTNMGHNYPKADSWCTDLNNNSACWTWLKGPAHGPHCYQTEDHTNNYIALRRFEDGVGTLYGEFQKGNEKKKDITFDKVDFIEHFHVAKDTWQLHNLAKDDALKAEREKLHKRVHEWYQCKGKSCRNIGVDAGVDEVITIV